jgi:anti-sigma factor RsiW
MRCRQASQLISEGFDRTLSRSERRRLRLHLLTCTACRRFRAHLRLLDRLLPVLLAQLRPKRTSVRLPVDARRRIEGALPGTPRKEADA